MHPSPLFRSSLLAAIIVGVYDIAQILVIGIEFA
jgi:hypothetical protein